jgi:hypothetical protein
MRSICFLMTLLAAPVAALAQNPYPGSAPPASPWQLDGTGGSVVSIDTGSGLQLNDTGGSSVYNQYYAEHSLTDLTMESRVRLDTTTGTPNLLRVTLPHAGSPFNREPSIAYGVNATIEPGFPHFVLRANDGTFYADLGRADANFHVVQLYVDLVADGDPTKSELKASFDGALVLNNLAVTYRDTNFDPGFAEFGAGMFGASTGTTTATFDYVNYSAGDSVVPEPGAAALLALCGGGSLLGRRRRH